MKNIIVYVGMDVHRERFILTCYNRLKEQAEYAQKCSTNAESLFKYIEAMRFHYGDDARFICGYEAECFGYSFFRELEGLGIE